MDLVTVFNMFSDLWHLYKRIEDRKDKWSDAFWDYAIGEFGEFTEKYGNHKFARALCLAISDEFERRSKE